jgi:hypothetical protein
MDNLLKLAIEAHGGLERWRQFNEVKANVSITGALWHLKSQPDVLKNVQVVAQLHRQHLVTHLIGKDRRTTFTTGEVSIESESGVVKETRVDPVLVIHPLTRTDKAGLLGSRQQSGRYPTALRRVSHVFHPSEGLIPSTRPAEFHYR